MTFNQPPYGQGWDGGQSPYGQQQWGNQPNPYGQPYGQVQSTNSMAIAALISSLFLAPLGIVFGHIARYQIRRSGEGGSGLALAGLIIGYVMTIVPLIIIVGAVLVAAFAYRDYHHEYSPTYTEMPSYTWTPPSISSPP